MCKIENTPVMSHLGFDGVHNFQDIIGLTLTVADANELGARMSTELGFHVLFRRQVDIEPVAPCDFLPWERRNFVDVIEEPLDGVRVVVFELHHCQVGSLHGAHFVSMQTQK